jgi:fatty acid desaturase
MAAARAHPSGINLTLAAFHFAVNVYQFLVVPVWLLPLDAAWAWTLLPLAFLHNSYWSLIHEAIHDLFHPALRVNMLFGRMAGVLFGAPFRILRLSHLLHHKLNRTPMEATELFDPAKSSRCRAALGYYFQILGGLYLVEFLSSVLFFLPRSWIQGFNKRFIAPDSVSRILMQNWTSNESIREIRTDGMLVLGWLGFSLWCYGEHWPLLLAILGSRGFFISFLDNVYHYRTPVNDIFYASNLWLPAPCAKLLLNFNLHGVHHQNPAVPWNRLSLVFYERAEVYHGNYFVAAAWQLNGPVALQELTVQGSNVQKFKVGTGR